MQVWIPDTVAHAYVVEHGSVDDAKDAMQEIIKEHEP